MTSLNTLPIPRVHPAAPAHEHAWLVESRHPTSEGIVLYVRCSACDTRRVDLQAHPHIPPAAMSTDLGGITPSAR
ncbi:MULTISPECIES: hypothetical protein [Microbacterium]|uniref:Uncharacterized protein n=1 Tax=Microbacterium maritypicum TaxID=33918 RepID=A0AAJ5V9B9_MICMQ|nr:MULTISPECIES: hypothetical protein [Microbacterium]EYT61534.1 hypothetical protein D514_0102015 [Microbacterium sp. UCD-TDU]MBP5803763.1 hypothetical protein [Microbacterium liquefaciens]WEF20191.1 hypothetical protein PWF71_12980 [Microbacterium liquefaciens]